LDVGTSTGTNLRLLKELGFDNFVGLDASEDAIAFCASKGLGQVRLGDATRMPFDDMEFSLVLATDIIEHVDDDLAALSEIHRVLRPGGSALITVPAFMSLWGFQDDVSRHKRRYRMSSLLERIRSSGFVSIEAFYFNYVLFSPIWTARQLMKWVKPPIRSENELNSPLINSILTPLFAMDVATAPWLRPPFGVSALVLAERPQSQAEVC
jgi:SAM-dependent methyltransferase